jgi:PIN domain nuclease of toxin-antitoxin system
MGGNDMNRLALLILATLQQSKATMVVSAMSVYEIKTYAKLEQSITTLHRAMNFLLNEHYIEQGLKDSKSNTFYLTPSGEQIIKEML